MALALLVVRVTALVVVAFDFRGGEVCSACLLFIFVCAYSFSRSQPLLYVLVSPFVVYDFYHDALFCFCLRARLAFRFCFCGLLLLQHLRCGAVIVGWLASRGYISA